MEKSHTSYIKKQQRFKCKFKHILMYVEIFTVDEMAEMYHRHFCKLERLILKDSFEVKIRKYHLEWPIPKEKWIEICWKRY